MSGWISHPKIHFQSKEKQVVFVNKRLVKSPTLYKAIFDAYNRFIPHSSFPAYVLDISIDPTQVDVNVHPRKQEIRFANEQSVFRTAYNAVEKTLDSVTLISHDSGIEAPSISETITNSSSVKKENYYTGSGTKFHSYSPYKNTTASPHQSRIFEAIDFTKTLLKDNSENFKNSDLHFTKLGKIVGQVFASYIIVESGKKLIIFDQHALAERINFEKLCNKQTQISSQQLLIPSTLHLSGKQTAVYQENIEVFESMGFSCELFSGNSLIVNAAPDYIQKENITDILT